MLGETLYSFVIQILKRLCQHSIKNKELFLPAIARGLGFCDVVVVLLLLSPLFVVRFLD